jgi:hypothetical protein
VALHPLIQDLEPPNKSAVPVVDLLESLVDLLESLVDPLEPATDLIEPPVDLIEPPVHVGAQVIEQPIHVPPQLTHDARQIGDRVHFRFQRADSFFHGRHRNPTIVIRA